MHVSAVESSVEIDAPYAIQKRSATIRQNFYVSPKFLVYIGKLDSIITIREIILHLMQLTD